MNSIIRVIGHQHIDTKKYYKKGKCLLHLDTKVEYLKKNLILVEFPYRELRYMLVLFL